MMTNTHTEAGRDRQTPQRETEIDRNRDRETTRERNRANTQGEIYIQRDSEIQTYKER